jgi:hypothetical protein
MPAAGRATLGVLLVVLTLGVAGRAHADPPSLRDRCAPVASPVALPVDPFRAIGREYVAAAVAERSGTDSPLAAADLDAGALVVGTTGQGQAFKLAAAVAGPSLEIRAAVLFTPAGGETAGRAVRLAPGEGVAFEAAGPTVVQTGGDVRWEAATGGLVLRPQNGARLRAIIAVPVVVHYMKSRDPFFGSNDVIERFPVADLVALFAPAAAMNTLWQPGGVFFFLHGVEHCEYLMQELAPGAAADALENVPYPMRDCLALFNRINRAYNWSTFPALDVYVWWSIAVTGVIGYAAPHKQVGSEVQTGAIWLDRACLDPSLNVRTRDCSRTLAHEAGHFLGVCHRCLTEVTPPPLQGACGICPGLRVCAAPDQDFLMRDDIAGSRLGGEEIATARAKARERFRGSPAVH